MNTQIEQILANLTEEEAQALLSTELPEELEKQAAAELASEDLAQALYAFGAYQADRELAEIDGVEKVAAEQTEAFDSAEAEIANAIEEALEASGVLGSEDELTVQKEAQAAAGLIFAGYSAQIEKIAEDAKAVPGKMAKVKAALVKMKESAKAHAAKAKGHVGAHAGKYGLAAGIVGGIAAKHMHDKHMSKKASELSVDELTGQVLAKLASAQEIELGVEKLANAGEAAAKTLMEKLKGHGAAAKEKAMAAGKYLKANVKPIAGGAAGGAVVGALGHKALSKKED